jgi:hydrogenase maturation protease
MDNYQFSILFWTLNSPKILLIGVGNEFRQDDGVGLVILEKLQQQIPAGIETIEVSGEGVALMEAWQGAETVYLFDASRSGAKAAIIHRFDALVQSVPRKFFNCSTHTFGVAEAVELARSLNQLPPKLIIYAIEGKNFALGFGLSPEIEQAAAEVVRRVLSELARSLQKAIAP